jgi:transcriptional regulator with XRE-family HTH domain
MAYHGKKMTDEIVAKIKRLRAEENLTDKQLAERFGVNKDTIRIVLAKRK